MTFETAGNYSFRALVNSAFVIGFDSDVTYASGTRNLGALAGGTAGFVLKNCRPEELIRAVRAAHEGDAYLSPAVTRMVLGMVTPVEPEARREAAERLAALTVREADVVHLVAEGLSNAEIARHLVVSEATVKSHVNHLLAKIGARSRAQAVSTAFQHGLATRGEAGPPSA